MLLAREAFADIEPDLGVFPVQSPDDAGQEIGTDRRGGAKTDRARSPCGWRLLATAFPAFNGTHGVAAGLLVGLDAPSAAALGILAASASYIAVPAARRMSLPQADAGLYLALSLGVTFPFNIVIGIPALRWLAENAGAVL